jgi:hypothetical protein
MEFAATSISAKQIFRPRAASPAGLLCLLSVHEVPDVSGSTRRVRAQQVRIVSGRASKDRLAVTPS